MKKLTDRTIVDIEDFIDHLEIVKERGWSNDTEEYEIGVSCVGAPIRDYRNQIIAAISSAWEGIKEPDEIRSRGEMLKSVGEEISHHLGYIPRG